MELNEVTSGLTNHDSNYIQCNRYMIMLYNGLPKVAQVALAIFSKILVSKYHGLTNKPNEDRRIYNDKSYDPSDIAKDVHAGKYPKDSKKLQYDAGNIRKDKLKPLDDNNVFHIWSFGGSYLYFMDREFACWKYYNEEGVLVPKTLSKILFLYKDVIGRMFELEKAKGRVHELAKIEESFALFINRLIDKMHPLVARTFHKWNQGQDIKIYVRDTMKEANSRDKFEGLTIASSFYSRLPHTVHVFLEELVMKQAPDKIDMVKAITPTGKAKNLGKPKRKKTKRKTSTTTTSADQAEIGNWKGDETLNPLENSAHLVRYYRYQLKYFSNQKLGGLPPKFDKYEVDGAVAAEILDMMQDAKRKNELFLREWVSYFCRQHLKGKKITRISNTSMSQFKKTFTEFNQSFYVSH